MKVDLPSPIVTLFLCLSHFIARAGARDGKTSSSSSSSTHRRSFSLSELEKAIHPEERLAWNNGALPLVLSALSDKLVAELGKGDESVETLSPRQSKLLASKLKGLYAHLMAHPALMERRLYVGSKKPEIPPHPRLKRAFDEDIAQPVCPDRTEWKLLHWAKDINDTVVEVFQPERNSNRIKQWFYTVTCDNKAFRYKRECPGCCMGIDHDDYNSSCRQKKTYIMALVRRPETGDLDWNWIQVNTGCTCAVTQKFDVMFEV